MKFDGPYLLDVNVLIALFDSAHIHHAAAHEWFDARGVNSWRTCPVTENGFMRILSHPAYPNGPLPISDLAERLEDFKRSSANYAFWPEGFSTARWVNEGRVRALASNRLTDAYLLKVAKERGGGLATFDLRIAPELIGESGGALVEHIAA